MGAQAFAWIRLVNLLSLVSAVLSNSVIFSRHFRHEWHWRSQLHSAMMQSRIRNDLSESSNAPQPSIKPAIARDAIVASVQDVNNSYANIRALHDADSRVHAREVV